MPPLSKMGGGAQVGLLRPPFGQSKCSNFTICSYFVIKKQICIFVLARVARQLLLSESYKLCYLKDPRIILSDIEIPYKIYVRIS